MRRNPLSLALVVILADALAAQPPPTDLQPQVDELNALADRVKSIIPDATP
jgi:hypothetical protein